MIQTFFIRSSQEKKRGSSSTILKRRDRGCSGRPQNHPNPKKARMSKSKIKVMLIAFFDQKGLVHHEFVPEDKTVNQYFYQRVLIRLHDRVRCSRRRRWSTNLQATTYQKRNEEKRACKEPRDVGSVQQGQITVFFIY